MLRLVTVKLNLSGVKHSFVIDYANRTLSNGEPWTEYRVIQTCNGHRVGQPLYTGIRPNAYLAFYDRLARVTEAYLKMVARAAGI